MAKMYDSKAIMEQIDRDRIQDHIDYNNRIGTLNNTILSLLETIEILEKELAELKKV